MYDQIAFKIMHYANLDLELTIDLNVSITYPDNEIVKL